MFFIEMNKVCFASRSSFLITYPLYAIIPFTLTKLSFYSLFSELNVELSCCLFKVKSSTNPLDHF